MGRVLKRGTLYIAPDAPDQFKIETGWKPTSVSLVFCDQSLPSTCVGDVDAFDATILPKGFVITARVKGAARKVKWVACGKLFG